MVPYVVYSLTYSPREQRQGIRTIRTIHTVSKVLFFFEYRNKTCDIIIQRDI